MFFQHEFRCQNYGSPTWIQLQLLWFFNIRLEVRPIVFQHEFRGQNYVSSTWVQRPELSFFSMSSEVGTFILHYEIKSQNYSSLTWDQRPNQARIFVFQHEIRNPGKPGIKFFNLRHKTQSVQNWGISTTSGTTKWPQRPE